jgi:hypothetical protein
VFRPVGAFEIERALLEQAYGNGRMSLTATVEKGSTRISGEELVEAIISRLTGPGATGRH